MNDMNGVERDQVIEEAAALSAGDPRRRELVDRIDAEGDEARRDWSERSASYGMLRQRLKEVVPPAGMVEQLLLIPGTSDRSTRRSVGRRLPVQRWLYAAAAAIVVTAVIASLFLRAPSRQASGVPGAVGEFVALMIADHAKRPALVIESSDPRDIERHLNSPAKRPAKLLVRVPDPAALGEGFHLQGGRLCKFDARPIAYTRWDHRGIEHSLYQVEPDQFALPSAFERMEVLAEGHRVVLWREDGMAYGLVCPH